MKLRIALTGLFILAAVLGEVIAVEEIGAVEEKLFSHKYALLIGVEDYPGTGNDLDYCLDDLYDMQEALINFCNFSISDIRILTDSNATKSNIQSAIDWLAANADNNDTVMFFYSGHGMSSGKLAQYDYSTQGGITSAELDSWLDSVNSSIIVVLDCCFAGAFTSKLHNRNHFSRDFTLKSMLRSLSKNAKCVFENTKERSNFVRGLAQEGRIICAACDENEYSWEFDELRNGAFSYYFTQALQSLKSDVNKNDWVSCEEAFEDAKPKVKEFVKIYANDTQIPKIYDGIPNEVDLVFFNVSKDIMVTTPTIIENKNLLLRGNLTVLSQLELSNTTLVLLPSYDGEFQIGVEPETALHIHNSTITSWDYNKHYLFYVKNASFKIENSSLQYCGYSREKIGLNIKNCTYIQIKNSSFSDSFFGLSFESCTNINIDSCDIIRNNDYGLILTNCTNADINNSRILNDEINICLANSSNISIWNCTISKGNYGIWFFYSSGNRIAQSNISDNYHGGVRLYEHSTNNTLAECLVCNNEYGIWLDSSSNNLLTCNTLNNNLYNFVVSGNEIFDFHQNIDTTNTINGKPMYYIVGESNRVFNETLYAGYLGLISCNNITVKKLELANNTHGLLLVNTSQSTIAENKIFSNYWYGIYLWNSPDNNISANQIYNNYYGIYLCSSSCNVIANCSIYNNLGYGIYICRDSINNLIYRNNFINNSYQAYDECNNYWDDGKIGNYWSDFYSEDLDSDGICDNPYIISGGNNKDTNPLFEPVGIDSIWPRIVISGVANNTCYNSTVVPIIDIWDINLNLSLITLNGESFVSGRPINREGNYTLVVQAYDGAGNTAIEILIFTVDKSEPAINVKNVTNGTHYRTNITPEICVYDPNLDKVSIKLNDEDFIQGRELTEERGYTLHIEALDKAGNLARTIIYFVIDKTEPFLDIISPPNNLTTTQSVTLLYSVYDNFDAPENIIVNIENGTTFVVEGAYLVYVYARDTAGNVAQKSVRFQIIPSVEQKEEVLTPDLKSIHQFSAIAAIAMIIIVLIAYIFRRARK